MRRQNRNAKIKRVVVVDHFDSFTHNMVARLILLGAKVYVVRTDTSIKEIEGFQPTHIVLSAGEGHPKDVLLFHQVLAYFKEGVPILGICLGHQAIGLHFKAAVVRSEKIMHGKSSVVYHKGDGIFFGVPDKFRAQRYHSLVIVKESIRCSETLRQTARTSDGTIMGIESVKYPHVVGVQFHPESYFTEFGPELFENFLQLEVLQKQPSPCVPVGFGQVSRGPTRGTRGWG